MSNISAGPESNRDERILLNIFSSIGRCRFLDEKHFDACTALAGAGPAFACIVLEAMADGGVMMGLPRAEALEMACQSMRTSFICFAVMLTSSFSFTRDGTNGSQTEYSPCTDS